MSALDGLLNQVKNAITDHARQNGHDPNDLLSRVTDLFGKHGEAQRNVKPASQDPYGDPADQESRRNVKPASQDPYGDPADQRH